VEALEPRVFEKRPESWGAEQVGQEERAHLDRLSIAGFRLSGAVDIPVGKSRPLAQVHTLGPDLEGGFEGLDCGIKPFGSSPALGQPVMAD